jgi:hypothetical protein
VMWLNLTIKTLAKKARTCSIFIPLTKWKIC